MLSGLKPDPSRIANNCRGGSDMAIVGVPLARLIAECLLNSPPPALLQSNPRSLLQSWLIDPPPSSPLQQQQQQQQAAQAALLLLLQWHAALLLAALLLAALLLPPRSARDAGEVAPAAESRVPLPASL